MLYIKDFKIEPEVLYSNKKDIVEKVENNANIPTVYILNSNNNNNRFLDDILNTIKNSLKLENTIYLERLNVCDVYLVN